MQNNNITQLLNQWIAGDTSVENELIDLVYPLLRKVAHSQLNKARDANLDTTMIVNELYLKLKQQNIIKLEDKNHFLALSAKLIRQIIVDVIRADNSLKRGKGFQQVTLQDCDVTGNLETSIDWLTLNKLLQELEQIDPLSVKLIELRFFVGLNIQETAEVCNTSTASISRNWHFAKSWLFNKLKE